MRGTLGRSLAEGAQALWRTEEQAAVGGGMRNCLGQLPWVLAWSGLLW